MKILSAIIGLMLAVLFFGPQVWKEFKKLEGEE